jgi:hypothetical protein
MIKYFQYIEIIPLALLTMFFLLFQENGHNNVIKKCRSHCIKIIISLLVMGFLFFMLVHTTINKYLILIISIILWVIFYLIKRTYISD